MTKYTKKYVNIISLLITIIIFVIINQIRFPNINKISISNLFRKDLVLVELTSNANTKENSRNKRKVNPLFIYDNSNDNKKEYTEEKNKIQKTQDNKNIIETKEVLSNLQMSKAQDKNWKIIIPKISLEAEISEGTGKEVMNKFVGHFEETATKSGNIGLAAHNRGYPVNYFANIKTLKEGDKIIYSYYDFQKTYFVKENKIIKDTDWEPLKDTRQNTITLITCVENEPEYRRCIQAIEKI